MSALQCRAAHLLFGPPDRRAGAVQALRGAAKQRLRVVRGRQVRRPRPGQLHAAALLRRARGTAAGRHVACTSGVMHTMRLLQEHS